jgi:NADH-quinone oxidoreductase subunit E
MDQYPMPDVQNTENKITEILEGFNFKADGLIPLLQAVQGVWGFLPASVFPEIARLVKLSVAEIFETASFYSQFRFQPAGKYVVRVCCGTNCHIHGSDRILEDVQNHLSVAPGETTQDRLFTLETGYCLGACAQAPNMVIEDSICGRMNHFKVQRLLTGIMRKEKG